jgi:hypothetical protein
MPTSPTIDRRSLLRDSAAAAAGIAIASLVPNELMSAAIEPTHGRAAAPRLRFGVVGMNHSHIYGQVDAVVRGGGELVSFYAKEPDLAAAFAKRYPSARQTSDERAVLEDPSI